MVNCLNGKKSSDEQDFFYEKPFDLKPAYLDLFCINDKWSALLAVHNNQFCIG
jgi:hypothetical protein